MVCQGKGIPRKISLQRSRFNELGTNLKTTDNSVRSRKGAGGSGRNLFLLLLQNQKENYKEIYVEWEHKQENMTMLIHTFICRNFDSKEHSLKYIFESVEKWLLAMGTHTLLFTSLKKCFCNDVFSPTWEMLWLLWLFLHEFSSGLDEDAVPLRIASAT